MDTILTKTKISEFYQIPKFLTMSDVAKIAALEMVTLLPRTNGYVNFRIDIDLTSDQSDKLKIAAHYTKEAVEAIVNGGSKREELKGASCYHGVGPRFNHSNFPKS